MGLKKTETIIRLSVFVYGALIGVVIPVAMVIWYWDSIKGVTFIP